MKRAFLLSVMLAGLLLSMTACSVNPKSFTGPNGRPAYAMKCSGMGREWSDCFTEAGNLCPRGYDTVSQTASPALISGDTLVTRQELAIECR